MVVVADGKLWEIKVGFSMAHFQSLVMDSQLDFGKNLQDEGAIITTYNHMLPSPSKIKSKKLFYFYFFL